MAIAQMPSKLVYETDELHFISRQAGCKGFSFHSLHSVFQAVKVFFFSVFVFISLSSFIYIYPSFLSMMQLFPFPFFSLKSQCSSGIPSL